MLAESKCHLCLTLPIQASIRPDWNLLHFFIHSVSFHHSPYAAPFSTPLCFVSPLVGARGSGPPLICSQNKQAGKHHETFRGGRAVFSLIHTGNPEMHSNSCSQCLPFRAGLHLRSSYIYSVRIRSLNGTSICGWNLCRSVHIFFFSLWNWIFERAL